MSRSAKDKIKPKLGFSGPLKNHDSSKENVQFEVLPIPTKSFSDKKEYRVIRLQNGLTACLISDVENNKGLAAVLAEGSDVDTSDEDDSSSESGKESPNDIAEQIEDDAKSNKRDKSQDEIKLAAASLCIGVGSFSDPKEIPGLAHFVEHMVFMGSEKFPKENDFDAFIKKHGGSDNASTDYETTTFYFECFEKYLLQGLDRFAQFFISPLMKRDSLTREREAVESEFQMAMESDDDRKEQLLISLSKEDSPINSFSWGNLITLKHNISEDRLYEMLHEFRRKHYSSHRMTLAIQARLPLDMLQSYVTSCFSDIPNNGLPPLDFKSFSEQMFDTPQFKRLYYIKPVKDICQLHITWVMPSLQQMYKSKPHIYVSWLLGHEGKGSLLSCLRKKVWALNLYAGNDESGAEFNSMYATFTVAISLTKDGLNHVDDVIQVVFNYIAMLKDQGACERIFKEIQTIEEQSFRFGEEESAVDNIEELSENMQLYPSEDYLTGPELFFEYNPDGIQMVLDHLVPDKMNIMIISSDNPERIVYDKVEPWFKTQYTDIEIPSSWMGKCMSTGSVSYFALPEPNLFLTTDFSILPEDADNPEYPQKIMDTEIVELWYRKDQKFGFPVAYYYYYFITPLATESAQSVCMISLFIAFLIVNLTEDSYPATISELSFSMSPSEKGITLKVFGFNEKLPSLIELIVKHMKSLSFKLTVEMFEALKEKQTKSFYNAFLKPSKLCKDVRLDILRKDYVSFLDKHNAVFNLTFQQMKQFSETMFDNLRIQCLVQGNVTKEKALETTAMVLAELNCNPLHIDKQPKLMVNELPLGEYCCRIKSFDKMNSNSIITNYYQCGPSTIKDCVILDFLMFVIEEPLFDMLRTKEQLGYEVDCTIRDTHGILGYSITVNTQADKHTTEHVDSRIEAFIKLAQKRFEKMSEKKFAQVKRDLIKIKNVVDTDLEDEVYRNWEEVVNGKNLFDRIQREIKEIENLKLVDVREFWDKYNIFNTDNSCRKLSVQVVGYVQPEAELKDNNVDQTVINEIKVNVEPAFSGIVSKHLEMQEYTLEFLENQDESSKKHDDYFIKNVGSFKRILNVFPDNSAMS